VIERSEQIEAQATLSDDYHTQVKMPELILEPETTPAMGQQQNQNQRRQRTNGTRVEVNKISGNTRKSNLAIFASAVRSFKGKIEELPIIGKQQYETAGVAFDVLQ